MGTAETMAELWDKCF